MKVFLTFLFTGWLSCLAAQGPDQFISCHVNQSSFEAFSQVIFEKSGVVIYYQEPWVNQLLVTVNDDHITVVQAVNQALQNSGLTASVWNNKIVVLQNEKLLDTIPAFEFNSALPDSVRQKEKTITDSEERYLTGRMADALETICIGKEGGITTNTKAKVLGRVMDEETGEPVIFATMFISELETGVVSDIDGYFSILLKPGSYNALFEFLGYEKKKYLLEVLSDGDFTIRMRKAVIQMKELVIHGDPQMSMKSKDPGLDKIVMKTIKELPMMMGERNILQVSALLPGIVNTGEGSAGLNVRGGGADQNAFYINKIPVYNTSHLFGFFPAFNSDIIKDFSIYKGYIPAQYGGRLSSVFNVVTRQGNLKHFTAHGGLSPITGNVVVEGPIKKDTCSVIFSARTSYSDWILKKIQNPTIRSSAANFYDLSGGINYDIQKTQLAVFAYRSYDRFKLGELNDYSYGNTGVSLTFNHRYSHALRGEYALIGSTYAFSTTDKQEVSNAYEHGYKMGHYEARADFKHILSEKHTLDYGVGFLFYNLDRGKVVPFGEKSVRSPLDLGGEKGLESALFIGDSYDITRHINVTAGIRYTLFTPLGSKTVYTYAEGAARDERFIIDSIQFGNNKPIKWYSEPDVRAAVNIETDVNGSVKLSLNTMHQNLFLLNNTPSVAPNAQWKLADYYLKPANSYQVSLGVFRVLPKKGLETSVEVYYKRTNNYSDFKDGANFLGSPLVETAVLQGEQKAYGVEFLLKRTNHRLEGWLSYTFSRSIAQVDGEHVWDKINDGESFPANFDIPHVVNVVGTYHFNRRITFSSIITYQSGKPVTYPVAVYYVDGVPTLDFSSRNAYRIPNYFRTDLSFTFEGNLRKDKLVHSSFSLNLYNALARNNPYAVYFQTADGHINSYKYSVIGVPVFTASWIFKFGNYASE